MRSRGDFPQAYKLSESRLSTQNNWMRPGFDLVAKRGHQPEILVIVEPALPGRKDNYPEATISKYQQFHFTVKPMAEPFVIFALHPALMIFAQGYIGPTEY